MRIIALVLLSLVLSPIRAPVAEHGDGTLLAFLDSAAKFNLARPEKGRPCGPYFHFVPAESWHKDLTFFVFSGLINGEKTVALLWVGPEAALFYRAVGLKETKVKVLATDGPYPWYEIYLPEYVISTMTCIDPNRIPFKS
jgi:hypothetical protein